MSSHGLETQILSYPEFHVPMLKLFHAGLVVTEQSNKSRNFKNMLVETLGYSHGGEISVISLRCCHLVAYLAL